MMLTILQLSQANAPEPELSEQLDEFLINKIKRFYIIETESQYFQMIKISIFNKI